MQATIIYTLLLAAIYTGKKLNATQGNLFKKKVR